MEENKLNVDKQISMVMVDILTDVVEEQKKVQKRQSGIIVLLICILFASYIYFVNVLNSFDVESTVTTTTTTDNNSKIDNSKYTNAQNNINLSIPKPKK